MKNGDYSNAAQSFAKVFQKDQRPEVQVRLGYSMFLAEIYSMHKNPESFEAAMVHMRAACEQFAEFQNDQIFWFVSSELRNQEARQIIKSSDVKMDQANLDYALNNAKATILSASSMFETYSSLTLFTLTQVSLSYIKAGDRVQNKTYYDSALELLTRYEELSPEHTSPGVASQLGYIYMNKSIPDYNLARECFNKSIIFNPSGSDWIEKQLARINELENQ